MSDNKEINAFSGLTKVYVEVEELLNKFDQIRHFHEEASLNFKFKD